MEPLYDGPKTTKTTPGDFPGGKARANENAVGRHSFRKGEGRTQVKTVPWGTLLMV